MPVNRSTSKVRVTKLYGTDSCSGLIDPMVDMNVRHGTESRWIKALDSGNFQVGLALASGGAVIAKAYPHDLKVSETVAQYWGWPTSTGSVTAGHSGVFPNGVPQGIGSGMAMADGDDVPFTWGR
jgi:hypothetical protein